MKDGFFRVSAVTPKIRVADPVYNREEICKLISEGHSQGVGLMVFPELCLTGYTCGDLFLQDALIEGARGELGKIVFYTKGLNMIVFVGLPWMHRGKLYNVAGAICDGRLLGVVPKINLPNYSEFYERRHFTPGNQIPEMTKWQDGEVPMGTNLLFACKEHPELVIASELCEDVWVPCPPSIRHMLAGATVIANCSASDEVVGKDMSMQMQERESRLRISYSAVTISLRRMERSLRSRSDSGRVQSTQILTLSVSAPSAERQRPARHRIRPDIRRLSFL